MCDSPIADPGYHGLMAIEGQDEVAIVLMNREDRELKRVSSLLRKIGLNVLAAANAPEAVALAWSATRMSRSIQVVIIDEAAAQPGMPALIEGLREADASIRILLISENNQANVVPSWMAAANIRGFLPKPFRRARFLGVVLGVMRQPVVRTV